MLRCAAASRCVVHLGGIGTSVRNQLGQRFSGNLPRTQDHDMRNARYHPDRDEILLDIGCEFWIDRVRYCVVRGTDEKSVTVWRRLGRGGCSHCATSAGAVVDQDPDTELMVELHGKGSSERIRAAA